jgi:hypothetical protein
MPLKNTLESKMTYRIKRSKDSVFMCQDFEDLSDGRQIRRILKKLLDEKVLVRIGYGLYVRTKVSSVTGKIIPEKPITDLAVDAVRKLGLEVEPTTAYKNYQSGQSTQVPTGRQIKVKGRISRKIGYDGRSIKYEAA